MTLRQVLDNVKLRVKRDAVATDANVADWLNLRAGMAQAEHRFSFQRAKQSYTINPAAANPELQALPTDFLDDIEMFLVINKSRIPLSRKFEPEALEMFLTDTTGQPAYWVLLDEQIQFYPIPDSAFTLELYYWQREAQLATTADDASEPPMYKWYPHMLIAGGCAEGFYACGEPQMGQFWEAIWVERKREAITQDVDKQLKFVHTLPFYDRGRRSRERPWPLVSLDSR